ncbi:MAG: SLC13 family permease [Caldilineaceae bacterium]|nr:SLC13 family permease [Caldilineaceae bacterium]MBP8108839.1 SLC13 family permease [Caldilineaceae bacterium]MBP8122734.1 SLC13 family permease [Caldilineaceae bacterium]MBP9072204.1 SLC13 family permease [Caldilineaceae bacterium]
MQIIALILIVVAATTLYITRWLSTEVTSILAIAALALTNVLTPAEAFAGFSSTATLTVGAMFVLSAGLLRTGALEAVTIRLADFSRGSPTRLLLLLGIIIPIASAFMNNTPVVVMMIPVILSLSARFKIQPSKLLIPVSYFAVLGGTITLIGTSTNILIDDLYRKSGGPGFGLFDFAPLGLIYCVIGVGIIVVMSQRLLPDRASLAGLGSQGHSAYITELQIDANSRLLGLQAGEIFQGLPKGRVSSLRHPHRHRRIQAPSAAQRAGQGDDGDRIELLEVFRGDEIFHSDQTRGLILAEGDALLVSGTPKTIALFMQANGVKLASVMEDEVRSQTPRIEQQVVEAVVLPDSPFGNRLLPELGFYRYENVSVMGVQRQGRQRRSGLRNLRLQSGDVLLLRGEPEKLRGLADRGNLLLVEGVETSIIRKEKNRVALLIMAGVIGLAIFSPIPISLLALGGAALMILTRCLRVDEAVGSLDPSTLLLLAATIPMGLAMESTGLARSAVEGLLALAGNASPLVFLSLFYLFTSLLTQIISNNAVAVLLTPIAINLALGLGLSPTPFLMAVAFGASASFMTPMGYQTNAIVMGPGGYTFADYLRMGVPLQIVMWITASVAIPLIWPLG